MVPEKILESLLVYPVEYLSQKVFIDLTQGAFLKLTKLEVLILGVQT